MSNTYTDKLALAKPGINDFNWADEFYRNQDFTDGIISNLLSVNRVLEGGVLSIGSGKNVTYTSGSCIIAGVTYLWVAGTALGASGPVENEYQTNWIYLNASGVVTISTDKPTGVYMLLGIADIDQTSIIRVADLRPLMSDNSVAAGIEKTLLTGTIVDVFIYDTTKDSDGGAWRKRCQNTSWYQETLNTATRGASREFPAIALLVLTTNALYIYEATDVNLRMWMVFNATTLTYLYSSTNITEPISIAALNGRFAVASRDVSGSGGCLSIWDFIKDASIASALIHIAGASIYITLPISGRNNSNSTYRASAILPTAYLLANRGCNDVAMAVIPGTAIDIATGLPVPTIAVATNAGVTILDGPAGVGTGVDIVAASGGNIWRSIAFSKEGGLCALYESLKDIHVFKSIPLTDYTINGTLEVKYYEGVVPYLFKTNANSIATLGLIYDNGIVALASRDVGGGLNLLKENPASPVNGLVAYINTDHNTGWMKGDIRGCYLADTVAGTIGLDQVDDTIELLTNGLFTSDVSSWTLVASASNLAWITGGKAQVTTTNYDGFYQVLTTVVGQVYTATIVMASDTPAQGRLRIGTSTSDNSHGNQSGAPLGAGLTATVTFKATTTTTYIKLGTTAISATAYFDSISVKLAKNLVENGDFNFGISKWTASNSATLSSAGVTLTITNGAVLYGAATQVISTVIGQVYTVTFDVIAGTVQAAYVTARDVGIINMLVVSAAGTGYTFTFKATTTTSTIYLHINVTTIGASVAFDNIVVVPTQNLVTNGMFSADYGWTKPSGVTITGGKMVGTAVPATSSATQSTAIVSGKKYHVKFTVSSRTAGQVRVSIGGAGFTSWKAVDGLLEEVVTEAGGAGLIYVTFDNGSSLSVDDLEVYPLDELDRCVKGNNLRVVGEITKTPVTTGAELVGYSNFLYTANRIETPAYDADFDFGTGDFYCMGWIKPLDASQQVYIGGYYGYDGVSSIVYPGWEWRWRTTKRFQFAIYTVLATYNTIYPSNVYEPGVWMHALAQSSAGYLEIYINGILIDRAARSGTVPTVSCATGRLHIGNGGPLIGVSKTALSALHRVGVGALTAEQIKFIYEQEKLLFLDNAKCKLQGGSSNIVDLSYDKQTNKINILTSTGAITQMQGLSVTGSKANFNSITPTAPWKKIASNKDVLLAADSANAYAYRPAINTAEQLASKDVEIASILATTQLQPIVFAGAGKTTVAMPAGFYPVQLYDAGVLEAFTISFDGFIYSAVLGGASAGDVTVMMRRI